MKDLATVANEFRRRTGAKHGLGMGKNANLHLAYLIAPAGVNVHLVFPVHAVRLAFARKQSVRNLNLLEKHTYLGAKLSGFVCLRYRIRISPIPSGRGLQCMKRGRCQ